MDKVNGIFSVAPMVGFKSVDTEWGGRNMSQSEPARDCYLPNRELVNVRLRSVRDDFFGGKESETYISEPLTRPSWRKVMGCFNKSIRATRDEHHIFLEAIHFTGEFHDDGCEYVDMWAGS